MFSERSGLPFWIQENDSAESISESVNEEMTFLLKSFLHVISIGPNRRCESESEVWVR